MIKISITTEAGELLDQIDAKQFLEVLQKSGLPEASFDDRRFREELIYDVANAIHDALDAAEKRQSAEKKE